jgi:hypothetical protein
MHPAWLRRPVVCLPHVAAGRLRSFSRPHYLCCTMLSLSAHLVLVLILIQFAKHVEPVDITVQRTLSSGLW